MEICKEFAFFFFFSFLLYLLYYNLHFGFGDREFAVIISLFFFFVMCLSAESPFKPFLLLLF